MLIVCSVYVCSNGQAVLREKFIVRICGSTFLPLLSEIHLHFPVALTLCSLVLPARNTVGFLLEFQQPVWPACNSWTSEWEILPRSTASTCTNSPPESTCLCSLYRPFRELFSFCFLFFPCILASIMVVICGSLLSYMGSSPFQFTCESYSFVVLIGV